MTKGPLELVGQVAVILDDLGISYALGDGLLDRMQIARRMHVTIPGIADRIWVTSPEDQVLRKLDWYRSRPRVGAAMARRRRDTP